MKRDVLRIIILTASLMLCIGSLSACGNNNESKNAGAEADAKANKDENKGSSEIYDPNRKKPNPYSVAESMNMELYKHFELKDGVHIYPDDFCGSYTAEDGYHILLTSLDEETIKKYNGFLGAYSELFYEYVFYEPGKLSVNTMQTYADDLELKLSEKDLKPYSIAVNPVELKIVIIPKLTFYNQTIEAVKEILDTGDYENLDISDMNFRNL